MNLNRERPHARVDAGMITNPTGGARARSTESRSWQLAGGESFSDES
jgi:hypothetical protein